MLKGPLRTVGSKNGEEPGNEIPQAKDMGQVTQFPAQRATAIGLQHGRRKKCTHYVGITSAVQEPRGTMGEPSNRGPGVATQSANPRLPCPIQWKVRTTRCDAALRPKLRCHLPHHLRPHPYTPPSSHLQCACPTGEQLPRSRDFLCCSR